MTIIENVITYLKQNHNASLRDLYTAFPQYTESGIRGCINRYLLETVQPAISRTGKGQYTIIEIFSCEETEKNSYNVTFSSTLYENNSEITCYYKDFKTETPITCGIYTNSMQISSAAEYEEHIAETTGILLKGDMLELLKTVKTNSFDLLVTDPPYRTISGGSGGKNAPKGMLSKNDGKIFEYNNISFTEWLPEVFRVLKEETHAYIFSNCLNLNELWNTALKTGFKVQNLLIWKKNNMTPNRYGGMKNLEYILMLRKGRAKPINNPSTPSILEYKNIIGNKLHPTEKPVELMMQLISNSSQPGQLVLDPFAGSGATAIAALKANRRFFTCEIDGTYHKTIKERIRKYLTPIPEQATLF